MVLLTPTAWTATKAIKILGLTACAVAAYRLYEKTKKAAHRDR